MTSGNGALQKATAQVAAGMRRAIQAILTR